MAGWHVFCSLPSFEENKIPSDADAGWPDKGRAGAGRLARPVPGTCRAPGLLLHPVLPSLRS